MFVQMISFEPQLPNLVWWCSIMSQSSMRGKKLLSSGSMSQRGFIWSKYDSFCYIFWTVDSLVTKLGLMIHHHMPECLMKNNGSLHSRARSQQRVKISVFVQIISFKPPNILLPNLVWWCSKMSYSVMWNKNCLLSSMSRSQWGLIWSKYDSIY